MSAADALIDIQGFEMLGGTQEECSGHQKPLYNQQILSFLYAQIEGVRDLEKPATATAEQQYTLGSLLAKGDRLLAKHATHFDVRDFYRTQDARKTVEKICEGLKEVLEEWGLAIAERIVCVIPSKTVEEDEVLLRNLLNYVLKGVPCDIEGGLTERWRVIRAKHQLLMRSVQIISEETLQFGKKLGQGGQGAVYRASWNGGDVAVKKGISGWRGDLPIEEFALVLKEALVHVALNHHPHILQLLATTTSGLMVLELADTDLHTMCHTCSGMSWRSKARLLRQGAAGLAYMHAQHLVHGDVKTRNFLVIGTDPESCRLKIGDFGLSLDMATTRSKSARHDGGTMPWMAPEIFQGMPVSCMSDVYGFGVVCYEVISGQQPYDWENTNVYAIMMKKASGKIPCTVGPYSCPPEMLELMKRCCAGNPEDRPTMEEVSEILLCLPEEWSPNSDATGNSDASAQEGQLEHQGPLYNRQIMGFLRAQLGVVQELDIPATAAAKQVQAFESLCAKGERLLAKHASHFHIRDFYRTQDACRKVEKVCKGLKDTLGIWGLSDAGRIVCCIPSKLVHEDEELLHKLLNYILKDVQCDIGDDLKESWEAVKARHEEDLKLVQIVDEGELMVGGMLGQGSQGAVFKATWRGTQVAIKKVIQGWEGDLPIEEFALFLKEALLHTALNPHPHIVQLLATTTSGWIVMELAESDLHSLCHYGGGLSWRSKARLLSQGAAGLAHMHARNLVHGDIKPQNFLIVENQPDGWLLKICDFGLSLEMTLSRSKSARMDGGTMSWIAPELFENQPISQESDVYSFGVVCYEVISGQQPYGWVSTSMIGIMDMKVSGREPCTVAAEDCPPQLMELMKRCCALDPAERPTMEEVKSVLLQLPEDWSPASDVNKSDNSAQEEIHPVSKQVQLRFAEPEFADVSGRPGSLQRIRMALGAGLSQLAKLLTTENVVITEGSPRAG